MGLLFLIPPLLILGFALFALLITIIWYIVKVYTHQIILLIFSILPFIVWNMIAKAKNAYIPLFIMEDTFLTKISDLLKFFSEILSEEDVTIGLFIGIYALIIFLGRLSKWNMASTYGCVASIAVLSVIKSFDILLLNNKLPGFIVFIISLIITVFFMQKGFHTFDLWIDRKREILNFVLGIIPTLIINFITLCNIFTMSFGTAVIGKFSFIIIAIILDILISGIGVVLFVCFKNKYGEIMSNKTNRFLAKISNI